MRAALWTVFLVVLPGLWFVAPGEALAGSARASRRACCDPWSGGCGRTPSGCGPGAGGRSRRPVPQPLPPVLIALELRRLELEIRRVEEGDAPHQAARLRAVLAAYDQLLLELCERVDVPTDDVGLPPLPSRERLTLEAELVAAGHDW